MKKLSSRPPRPRNAPSSPTYPRALAILMVASIASGCDEPEVALAGDVAPAYSHGHATSATPPAASVPGTTEVILGGEAPAPFAPAKSAK